ncbi:4'-phosphopantetheinyl transferase family protein [Niallia sp. FSL W8-1348]|uniref:4'-phosphopantetheinyl transferase family protein n=1 Tax=Niallia sp. FSL W8-1348 TaxID=2954656 RepID=UPI0030FA69DE
MRNSINRGRDLNNLISTPFINLYWYKIRELGDEQILKCYTLLNPEEINRADRYLKVEDKVRFIVGRGMLRKIISYYTSIENNDLIFEQNNFGKLYIKDVNLEFNVSHSGDYVVIAASYDNPLGVDIEKNNVCIEVEDIAEEFLTNDEISFLTDISNIAEKRKFYYKYWVRKEAVVKAIGQGLSFPLKDIVIPLDFIIGVFEKISIKKETWYIRDILLEKDYSCSIVARNKTQLRVIKGDI